MNELHDAGPTSCERTKKHFKTIKRHNHTATKETSKQLLDIFQAKMHVKPNMMGEQMARRGDGSMDGPGDMKTTAKIPVPPALIGGDSTAKDP